MLPTLHTARLILRPRDPSEASVYRQLWTERDPRVPPHRRPDADGRPTVADIAAALGAQNVRERWGLLAVERKDDGAVIGYCGLVPAEPDDEDDPELAFELLKSAHGYGYATEAGHAVLGWARRQGCRRLRAGVWEWNTASRRVLTKLGFHETGVVGPASAHGRTLFMVCDL